MNIYEYLWMPYECRMNAVSMLYECSTDSHNDEHADANINIRRRSPLGYQYL